VYGSTGRNATTSSGFAPLFDNRYAQDNMTAGNVFRRIGSTATSACPSNWLSMSSTWESLAHTIVFSESDAALSCPNTRCNMEHFSVLAECSASSGFINLIYCLEHRSFDNGQRRFPEPPDNKTIYMLFSILALSFNKNNVFICISSLCVSANLACEKSYFFTLLS